MNSQRIDIYISNGSIDLLDDKSTINLAKERIGEYLANTSTGFSISNQVGGYLCENGVYAIENSLRISLIGNFKDVFLNDFIEHFKKLYEQESVLVCKKNLNVKYY